VRDAEVRFAKHGRKSIAYEVFGTGPRDVLVRHDWCPIDLMWEQPQLASFMEALGTLARIIVFDPLGYGASDPISDPGAATLEALSDGVLAVLEAARAPRAILFDIASGLGAVTMAATFPQRVQSIIVVNLRASFPELRNRSPAEREEFARLLNGLGSLQVGNPRVAHDPILREWWCRARRLLTSPEQSLDMVEFATRMDAGPVLAAVRVPSLVLHRRDNRMFDIETSRAAASCIPGARFVELPGSESDLFLGDTAPVFSAIEEFLAEPAIESVDDRPLATVLFTDIVSSTEQLSASGDKAWRRILDDHDKMTVRIVSEFRGRYIKQLGDGALATFDGPARAVRCAATLREAARARGLSLRAGLHTGEVELRPADVTGIAVVIAQRISALAAPDEVLASRTVVDLTAGSGLEFEPRGEHQLKGVPGTWPTFAAQVNT
jgi:class 3 adenylate cyclase/pimeloyl-ACP methyl ester carboxylesterase